MTAADRNRLYHFAAGVGSEPVACGCMTETNPYDPDGPELVLTHSLTCPEHPDHPEES